MSGEAYDINKSKIESRAQYAPEPARGTLRDYYGTNYV